MYRLRYAFHLWWNIRDMTIIDAWDYPTNITERSDNPIEDAEIEMSYMNECS